MSSGPGETPQSVPFQPIPPITHVFTPTEIAFIQNMMVTTPSGFMKGCGQAGGFDMSIRLLGMACLALTDINLTPPCTQYTLNTLPPQLQCLITLGSQYYMMLMMMAGFSLIDINYNDNGFSLSVDRAAKISAAADKIKEQWEKQIMNFKHCLLLHNGGVGLGTPRYQSNIGRFIGMLGNGAFGWGIP
jgi:hypothetical protein